MKLVVGLGNPGKEYDKTRHNIGFNFLNYYASHNNLVFVTNKKFNAECCNFDYNGEKIMLIKPLSYMNLSGIVVNKYLKYYNLTGDDILVIQDDLDMTVGKTRVLYDSSSGGHNGIKNIIENIGTTKFFRFKIGISNDKEIDTKDYVLGNLNTEENKIINDIYDKNMDIITDFCSYSVDSLKQKYNGMIN